MTPNALHHAGAATPKLIVPPEVLLTPPEAAKSLKMSVSWLAKARMRGDGPPFVRVGRSIRYREDDLRQWLKAGGACRPANSKFWPCTGTGRTASAARKGDGLLRKLHPDHGHLE